MSKANSHHDHCVAELLIVDDVPEKANQIFTDVAMFLETMAEQAIDDDEMLDTLIPNLPFKCDSLDDITRCREQKRGYLILPFYLPVSSNSPAIQQLRETKQFLEFDCIWMDVDWGTRWDAYREFVAKISDGATPRTRRFMSHDLFIVSDNELVTADFEDETGRAALSAVPTEHYINRGHSDDQRKLAEDLFTRLICKRSPSIPVLVGRCANRGGFVIAAHKGQKAGRVGRVLDDRDSNRDLVTVTPPDVVENESEKWELVFADAALRLCELVEDVKQTLGDENEDSPSTTMGLFRFLESLAEEWAYSEWQGAKTKNKIQDSFAQSLKKVANPNNRRHELFKAFGTIEDRCFDKPIELIRDYLFKLYLFEPETGVFDSGSSENVPQPVKAWEHGFSLDAWLAQVILDSYNPDADKPRIVGASPVNKGAIEVFIPKIPFMGLLQETFTHENFLSDALRGTGKVICISSHKLSPFGPTVLGRERSLLLIQYSTGHNPQTDRLLRDGDGLGYLNAAQQEFWLRWNYELLVATGTGDEVRNIYQFDSSGRTFDGESRSMSLSNAVRNAILTQQSTVRWVGEEWACVVFVIDGELDDLEIEK